MANKYTFYSKTEYFQELEQIISKAKAKDKIALASMILDLSEPAVLRLVDALVKAASRGSDVLLMIDAYSFMRSNGKNIGFGPLFFNKHLPKRPPAPYDGRLAALKSLKKAGGRYVITNTPSRRFSRPFAGRSHLKFALINEQIFIGGCNLNQADDIDIMISFKDKTAADWIKSLAEDVAIKQLVRLSLGGKDLRKSLHGGLELLVDAGKPKQSIIFAEALKLIDEAEDSIFMTCQYSPNSTTLKHLSAAHKRGVQVTLIYNPPAKHGYLKGGLQYGVLAYEKLGKPSTLFRGKLDKNLPFLHAKVLVSEKAAIVGSHNFVAAGVNFGTAEIAIINHDNFFSENVVKKIKEQL